MELAHVSCRIAIDRMSCVEQATHYVRSVYNNDGLHGMCTITNAPMTLVYNRLLLIFNCRLLTTNVITVPYIERPCKWVITTLGTNIVVSGSGFLSVSQSVTNG